MLNCFFRSQTVQVHSNWFMSNSILTNAGERWSGRQVLQCYLHKVMHSDMQRAATCSIKSNSKAVPRILLKKNFAKFSNFLEQFILSIRWLNQILISFWSWLISLIYHLSNPNHPWNQSFCVSNSIKYLWVFQVTFWFSLGESAIFHCFNFRWFLVLISV